ncbi:TrmO family methyltransferase domain-containing protein [Eubacterium aggregans]|uniref:TrmO family methyltransferase domain-containing protein n=1 Tax=Eubacterium aggregans TaxID=81409 RepID=UPI003F3B756B
MRPIIGVTPLYDQEKDSLWMLPGYLDGLMAAGATPLVLPLTQDEAVLDTFLSLCHGFLFTGGQDVAPAVYQEEPSRHCGEICETRDVMEGYLLKKAVALDKPILGICRGIQLLNAVYGGKLYQDLGQEHPSDIGHQMKLPYDMTVHNVHVLPKTPLSVLLGVEDYHVNSYHHQGILTLAPNLRPMAVSPDGLIEAVYMPTQSFLWAVQWHPEFNYQKDKGSQALFKALAEVASPEQKEGEPIVMHPIGVVKNDGIVRRSDSWGEVVSTIVLDKALIPGLESLIEFSHIRIVFNFSQSPFDEMDPATRLKCHPRGRQNLPLVGLYATRTPNRPNGIGMTDVQLLSIEENRLTVKGLDAFDGTPILDIKPIFRDQRVGEQSYPDWEDQL